MQVEPLGLRHTHKTEKSLAWCSAAGMMAGKASRDSPWFPKCTMFSNGFIARQMETEAVARQNKTTVCREKDLRNVRLGVKEQGKLQTRVLCVLRCSYIGTHTHTRLHTATHRCTHTHTLLCFRPIVGSVALNRTRQRAHCTCTAESYRCFIRLCPHSLHLGKN